MPIHTDLLAICNRSPQETWTGQGTLPRYSEDSTMSPLGRIRLRPGTLIDFHTHSQNPGAISPQQTASLFFSLSLHPWNLTTENLDSCLKWIVDNLNNPRVIALGEAGIDRLCTTPIELQTQAFRLVAQLAEQYKMPLIIHCVRAHNEIIALHKKLRPAQPWIIHGFRGKPQLALSLIKQGICLSFGERFNTETLKAMPPDRILLETDQSRLHIADIYNKVAALTGISLELLANNVISNFSRIFNVDPTKTITFAP